MVCSNFQSFWLTALVFFGAVLQLVHGDYATCPTTREGKYLFKKEELQNASSYEEKKCTEGDKCCAGKDINEHHMQIIVVCSPSCTGQYVDCSEAANRCRDVSDITDYYKRSSDFVTCPYTPETSGYTETVPTSLNSTEVFCQATDKCSVLRVKMLPKRMHNFHLYNAFFFCMSRCKEIKDKAARGIINHHLVLECTECSGTDDCQLKLGRFVSHGTCPTTNGKRIYTERAAYSGYNSIGYSALEEVACTGSEKCCAEKSTGGRLTIKIECSASCDSPKMDCSQESNNCWNKYRVSIMFRTNPDYVSCMALDETRSVFGNQEIPEFKNVDIILCPKTEGCSVGVFDEPVIAGLAIYQAFAGCMTECERYRGLNGYKKVCKTCSTTDDCRKLLLSGFNETTTKSENDVTDSNST